MSWRLTRPIDEPIRTLATLTGMAPYAFLSDILVALYYALLAALSFFGIHRAFMVWLSFRHRPSQDMSPAPSTWPTVTVQLPIYNEYNVVQRLIAATVALDYPRDRIEIQVLDDSTDATAPLAQRLCEQYAAAGLTIRYIHRKDRTGFKAGALEEGLKTANGEFIAIFDADFVPGADFLLRTIPHFHVPEIGMVQARWDHLNTEDNRLTRVEALMLDAHFAMEHGPRCHSGRFFNFNGTAGVWRRTAIVQAGGWQHDTLTEDLDLSYRAQLQGWRFCYLSEVAVPAELPTQMSAFKSQQARWAKGGTQTARKLLGTLWRSDQPLPVKLEATFHLGANFSYLLLFLLALLIGPATLIRAQATSEGGPAWRFVGVDVTVFAVSLLSVAAFYLESQRALDRSLWAALIRLPLLMALGIGMSANNARAVWQGLSGPVGEFVRTPKHSEKAAPVSYRGRRSGTSRIEIALGLLLSSQWLALALMQRWAALPFLGLFAGGFLWTGLQSQAEERTGHNASSETVPVQSTPTLDMISSS